MMLGRNSMGYIWHQGTIYKATSYAVPVFPELLRQPATPGKHDVLAFLALLFTGRASWGAHRHTALLQSEVRKPGSNRDWNRSEPGFRPPRMLWSKGGRPTSGILEETVRE
jgi:hypothetical protein